MIDYSDKLDTIFDKLLTLSIKPVIVGGFVRDFLLQEASKDIDIELYGIESYSELEKILEEFGSVNSVGKSFGVCKLTLDDLDLDFSLPRVDSKVSKGHTGFAVKIDTSLDFKEATSRRDFTINAIGFDVETHQILDPFHGVDDLKNRILRAVDLNKFGDDPLRVLRAVQFSSRLHFALDDTLFTLCKDMIDSNLLDELPRERIFLEIEKLLLKSSSPSAGIELLKRLGAFNLFTQLKELTQEDYKSTLCALDKMSSLRGTHELRNTPLMLSLLCYKLKSKSYETFLAKLTTNRSLIKSVLAIVGNQNSLDYSKFIDYDIYLLATKVNIEEFTLFSQAITDSKSMLDNISRLTTRAKELGVFNAEAKALLQGRDILYLGIKPSKEFSTILDRAYLAQISGQFKTKEEGLVWLKELLST